MTYGTFTTCFFVQVSLEWWYIQRLMHFYVLNKYTHMKSTLLCFLCIYCAKIVHNKELFPARKRLALRACAVDRFCHQYFWTGGDFCSLFSMYQIKFDAKMTKSKWNMIMNVLGTVCQRIHYFPGKQWLAIDPTWPAIKVNAHGFEFISWSVLILILLFILFNLHRFN